jgi:hypothetical protein
MLAATGMRPGDITRSDHHTGEEYVKWRDITLKLKPTADPTIPLSVQDLEPSITMYYCKGSKYA